ncbi:MAG: hypothetical protein LUQ07_05260 [Methanospirillum sp.]|nr:hypothetical protein [Methanospirillum sp.]
MKYSQQVVSLILLVVLSLSVPASAASADTSSNISQMVFSVPGAIQKDTGNIGHDYVLLNVVLSQDYTYVRSGRSISPRITIKNQGGDDTNQGNVPVEAWLGDTILIPVHGEFIPLKGGTSAMYTLRYMIPQDVPLLPNHLTLKIDPWNTRNESGNGPNDLTTKALIVIEDKKADDFI